jgi:predicted small secreted protein
MRKLVLMLLALAGFSLAACNTVKGVGQDVEAAGRAVGTAAEEVEDEIDGD